MLICFLPRVMWNTFHRLCLLIIDIGELVPYAAAEWKSRLRPRRGRPYSRGIVAASPAGLRVVSSFPRVTRLSACHREEGHRPEVCFAGNKCNESNILAVKARFTISIHLAWADHIRKWPKYPFQSFYA